MSFKPFTLVELVKIHTYEVNVLITLDGRQLTKKITSPKIKMLPKNMNFGSDLTPYDKGYLVRGYQIICYEQVN